MSDITRKQIVQAENLEFLAGLSEASVDLIYIDPPFNTGKKQSATRLTTVADSAGDRIGFQGKKYRTTKGTTHAFLDTFDDFLAFLAPRLEEAHRVLAPSGSFFLHIDYREAHYCKILLDEIYGRNAFMNEIIWAYDFGGRPKKRWPAKHDTIFWYVKDPNDYTFNFDEMDRIPYMAPGLVTAEKAERGKTPTDVWWHTIVPTNGKERTGYPAQKPLGVLERIIKVHSAPGAHVLDFFAGSGTTGEAAALNGRNFTLVDNNPEAVKIMAERLARWTPECVGFDPPVDGSSNGEATDDQ